MRYLAPLLLNRLKLLIIDEAHQVLPEDTESGRSDFADHSSRSLRLESFVARLLTQAPDIVRIALTAVAGGAALGVLVHLGPRIGKFRKDGTARDIAPHHPWLVTIGLFLIYTGFWGFYVACNVPIIAEADIGATGAGFTATTIYLTPTTLSAIVFNFLMSLSGGMIAGYMVSRGDAFWTYSCGLAGIITASAGNDLYHPLQAMMIGGVGAVIAYKMHYWVERTFKIDDAVGAVAVHGYAGFAGLVIAGFMLSGHPSSPFEGYAAINPLGQFIGAVIMFFLLGFLPAWILAGLLKSVGLLRIPHEIELVGLDVADYHGRDAEELEVIEAEIQEARERGLLPKPAGGAD
jgi:ammonia channel protein AmtB